MALKGKFIGKKMTRTAQARPKKTQISVDNSKLVGWGKEAIKQYKKGFYAGREAGQGHGPIPKRGDFSDEKIVEIVDEFWTNRKVKKEFADKSEAYIQGWKDAYIRAVKLYNDVQRAQYRKERSRKRDENFVESDSSYIEEDEFDLPEVDLAYSDVSTDIDVEESPQVSSVGTDGTKHVLYCDESLSSDIDTALNDAPVMEVEVLHPAFSTPSISPLLRSPEKTPPSTPPLPSTPNQDDVQLLMSLANTQIKKPTSPLRSNSVFLPLELENFKRLMQKEAPKDPTSQVRAKK